MTYAFEYVGVVFALFTFPFYGLLLEIIRRFNKESTSTNFFYLILMLHGYVDLASILVNITFYTFPRWGFLLQFYSRGGLLLLRAGFFLSWGFSVMQAQATLLIGINRFTSVVCAARHHQYWQSKLTVVLFIVLPGVLMGTFMMWSDFYFHMETEFSWIPRMTSGAIAHVGFGVAGLLMITYSVSLIVMYVYIWYTLRMHRYKAIFKGPLPSSNVANRATIQRRREHKLLVMSFLICFTQLVVTAFLVYKFTDGTVDRSLTVYNCLSTIYSCVNPYLLIAFSEVIRDRFVHTFLGLANFKRVKPGPSSTTPVLPPLPSTSNQHKF